MGNWRTVFIEGMIDPADTRAAVNFIDIGVSDDRGLVRDWDSPSAWDRFHPLCYAGLSICGLGLWVHEGVPTIRVFGNLAERDYAVEDVAETLRELVAAAPSLDVVVHCGGEHEDTQVVATITTSGGVVEVLPPQVPNLGVVGVTEDA